MNYVDRPEFSEGQLLSAADLQLAVDYPRDELETHCSVAHTSGVIDGLNLQVVGSAPASVFVTVGLAVDDQGRQLTLAAPLPIAPDPLSGQPAGSYPAYIWYTEAPLTSSVSPLNPCSTATSDRVRETPAVGVFTDDASARAESPDAVCLGYLGWDGTSLQTYSGTAANVRQGGGVRAHEIVAPEHAVLVHAEDQAPTVFTVEGTLEAVASAGGTAPVITAPGGSLVFAQAAAAPATSTVSLFYQQPAGSTTGNGLAIDLGNNDPASDVVVQSAAGTQLAKIDGTGTITANTGAYGTLNASTSVIVSTGPSTITLGSTPPQNIAGVIASDTLALAFGTAAKDEVMFIAGATPVATIDANALTMTAKNVKVGVLDSGGHAGLGLTNSDPLEIRTATGDLLLNPGTQTVPPFRLTAGGRLFNQTGASPADVTPLTAGDSKSSTLRLGPLAIAFGTVNAALDPLSQSPATIDFPLTFTAPPAFFAAPCGQSLTTIAAVATKVTTTSADYRITQLAPIPPTDGAAATWTNAALDVTVSWIALGTAS
ncbi:MAG: hypothetical protein ABSH03_18510 [Candidatus Lustribacter sp.]